MQVKGLLEQPHADKDPRLATHLWLGELPGTPEEGKTQTVTRPDEAVRVGRIDASRAGWGKTAVRLAPDPLYPERRLLEGEIEGARWAVSGDFLDWAPGVRWLGLRPAHRVRALIGTGDPSGTAPTQRVVTIDAPPSAARLLLRCSRWIPFLTVRRNASPWIVPAERAVAVLYATPDGYVADTASTGGAQR